MNINQNRIFLGMEIKKQRHRQDQNRPFARSSHMVWINYTGTQVTQRDFQNKGTHTSPARLSLVLEVPLRNLRPSVIYSVPCDRIVQRAYSQGDNTVITGY